MDYIKIKKMLGILLSIWVVSLTLNQFKAYIGPAQTMSIYAVGQAKTVPDLAVVTLGVITQGNTPEEVKNSSSQKMNTLIDFLKQKQVDKKDISTSAFYTSPRYQYQDGKNTIIGYQAEQTVTVTLRNIDKSQAQLESIVDGAITVGANRIQGVRFGFADESKLKQLAIKDAIQKAKENAKQLTSEAGVRLGRVINVSQSANYGPPSPVFLNYAASSAKMVESSAATIEPGNQEVTVGVTLVFEVS